MEMKQNNDEVTLKEDLNLINSYNRLSSTGMNPDDIFSEQTDECLSVNLRKNNRKGIPMKLQNNIDEEFEDDEDQNSDRNVVTSESEGITEQTKTPTRKSSRFRNKIVKSEFTNNGESRKELELDDSESESDNPESTKQIRKTKTKNNGSIRRRNSKSSTAESRVVFRCDQCVYSTVDKRSYVKHRSKHDPSIEVQRYKCQVCSKSFRSHQGYKFHMITHGDPDLQLKCTHCNFNTPQKWSLHQHLAVIHKVDETGRPLAEDKKCPHCEFACVVDKQLKLHILRKHTLDKPFKCDQCDYATVVKTDLHKHISVTHKKERQYLCDVCGFRSQTHGGLERHKRAHLGLKPFKCDKCGMEYADLAKFKSHRQRHYNDEKPFVCHVCGHAFRRRDNLQVHLRKIHGTNLDGEVTRYSSRSRTVEIKEDEEEEANCSKNNICNNSDNGLTLTDMNENCTQLVVQNESQFMQSFSCAD